MSKNIQQVFCKHFSKLYDNVQRFVWKFTRSPSNPLSMGNLSYSAELLLMVLSPFSTLKVAFSWGTS